MCYLFYVKKGCCRGDGPRDDAEGCHDVDFKGMARVRLRPPRVRARVGRVGGGCNRRGAAGGAPARRRGRGAGTVRRVAGQPRDLVVGRRDPRRVRPGVLQGSGSVPPHRPGEAGGVPPGPQPGRGPHLGRRASPSQGVLAGTRGCATARCPGRAGGAARRSQRPDRIHASRLRHDPPDGGHERRRVAVLVLVRLRGGRGEVRIVCRRSDKRGSWAAPTTSSTVPATASCS